MKLNLVPTYVSKERKGRSAIVVMVIIMIIGIGLALFLSTWSGQKLAVAKKDNDNSKPGADNAFQTSAQADTVIAKAAQILKDTNLAQDMIAHNDVYPTFYTTQIFPYIPPFYRINTLTAQPIDADTCSVTMTGTLHSYQQYADLVLALMRIKGATSVSRAGFAGEETFVPALTLVDQTGHPRRTTDAPIPDNPIDRLAWYQSQGTPPPGYQGVGNFGGDLGTPRGAMPEDSLVRVVVTMAGKLQTPDPRATFATYGAASAAPAVGGAIPTGLAGSNPRVPGTAGGD